MRLRPSHRTIVYLAVLLPLFAACGSVASTQAKGDAGDAASCNVPQEVCCGTADGCSVDLGPATCRAGAWTCPGGGTPSAGCSRGCARPPGDSGSPVADAGGPVSSVYVTSTLGASTAAGEAGQCNVNTPDTPFITVGSMENPIASGGDSNGAVVGATCRVDASGSQFIVDLAVSLGAVGGITVAGTVTNAPGAQPSIRVGFTSVRFGDYVENDCTLTLSSSENPPVTAGRIAGSVTCPEVVDSAGNAVCAATASFMFENCE